MRTRSIVLIFVVCAVAIALSAADNLFMGTWKLNEAKSKIPAGAARNTTVVYSAAGDETKVTTDGTDGSGKPGHSEWTGKFDGKDYPVTGGANAASREYTQVNDHTMTFAGKTDGKVTLSGKIVVSADGKSRTVTVSSTDASGKKITTTAWYDKR